MSVAVLASKTCALVLAQRQRRQIERLLTPT
jgi:hypothetical protein